MNIFPNLSGWKFHRPFVQEQLEVLPLGPGGLCEKSSIDQWIEPFVNLCTFFTSMCFSHTKKYMLRSIPNSKVVKIKKSVDKVDLAWKKSHQVWPCHSVGVLKTSNKDTNKNRGHYITNPKECSSYQGNPWKLPSLCLHQLSIPPTWVPFNLAKNGNISPT